MLCPQRGPSARALGLGPGPGPKGLLPSRVPRGGSRVRASCPWDVPAVSWQAGQPRGPHGPTGKGRVPLSHCLSATLIELSLQRKHR